jgi:hypothetical protein
MPHTQSLYEWRQRVASHFTDLPRPHVAWLALASFGIVLAESALLNQVCLKLAAALNRKFNTIRQRLRKWYKPATPATTAELAGRARAADFDASLCFGPLLRWATAAFKAKRLVLAVDPTNLDSRFTILTISVVFRSCAVPVAWAVLLGDQKGSWNDHWRRLLGRLRDALGDGWDVLVLSDRGLESKTLFEGIVSLGWHPFMRAKKGGHFRPNGWHNGRPMGSFAAAVGANWKGRGVAWPTGSQLTCTLLVRWDEGHDEPWLVLTDLEPTNANAFWYAFRTWIEHGFRDLKSDGWNLSKTRMTDPQRVARWWVAAAVAMLWVIESGQRAEELEVPASPDPRGSGEAAGDEPVRAGVGVAGCPLGAWDRPLVPAEATGLAQGRPPHRPD